MGTETEQQFIDNAKALLAEHEHKADLLRSLIAAWQKNKGNGVATSESKTGTRGLFPGRGYSVAQWVRFGIEKDPNAITVPRLVAMITAEEPNVPITTAKVSQAIYGMLKAGEIETVKKSPGKPSVYKTTPAYKPSK